MQRIFCIIYSESNGGDIIYIQAVEVAYGGEQEKKSWITAGVSWILRLQPVATWFLVKEASTIP